MQVHWNAKNVFTVVMAFGFIYLSYLIFFSGDNGLPEVDVELRDIISYAVLAIEMGGAAVVKVHTENALNTAEKGLTDVGTSELLTKADLISNYLILDVLKRFLGLKIVSEEKDVNALGAEEAERYKEDRYSLWLGIRDAIDQLPGRRLPLSELQVFVDPLDATQEYTENLTEYVTVMVCVTHKQEPIFGAIFRPFQNETTVGVSGWGAMKSTGEKIHPVSPGQAANVVVVSRSHAGEVKSLAAKAFGDSYTVEEAGGGGYKTLRLVNGTAEVYLHQTAIKKWDTCAGDAILRSIGGSMLDLHGSPLHYASTEPILHKGGIVAAAHSPYTFYTQLKKFI